MRSRYKLSAVENTRLIDLCVRFRAYPYRLIMNVCHSNRAIDTIDTTQDMYGDSLERWQVQ
jgi:hypothetical protein